MAYWGQALALAPNINDSAIGPDRELQAYHAIQEAAIRKGSTTARERALIDALLARFAARVPDGDRRHLNAAYASAMRSVWAQFPADPDVAVLYADAVMNTRPWNYWTRDGRPRPGIAEARFALERTIQRNPNHPGARHTYIHLMEASDEVDVAIPSADVLGAMMPGAGHLVHMPSHIYMRVGRYADAVAANVKPIAADEDYITQCRVQGIYPAVYYPHNVHFLTAALAMQGSSVGALTAAQKAASRHNHQVPEGLEGFTQLLESLPLMTRVRFGQWDAILEEPERAVRPPFVRSIYHFARGMAFSATGRPAVAKEQLALADQFVSGAQIRSTKVLDLNSLADIAQIGVFMLRGDIAQKANQHEEAIAAFQRAVEIDDALLYSEPPDWTISPRQYLAHANLAAGKPIEAERIYREDLKRHRDNGWSLRGLEESLWRQGRATEADRVHKEFQKAWQKADISLPTSRF